MKSLIFVLLLSVAVLNQNIKKSKIEEAPKCPNFHYPLFILDKRELLHFNRAKNVQKNLPYYQYCWTNWWSCCTPGEVRKIGDNFNRQGSDYASHHNLVKKFKIWVNTIEGIFQRKVSIEKLFTQIDNNSKSYKD